MLNEWKMKFITKEGDPAGAEHGKALLIEGEACVDFEEQANDFCRTIRDLNREDAHIEIDLDIPKATAKFKICIPPKPKPIKAEDPAPLDPAPPAGSTDPDELPDDFPARELLIEAGFDTVAKVREGSEADVLIDISGIGPATNTAIKAALDAL